MFSLSPQEEEFCANPSCSGAHVSTKLMCCSRCRSASYCSRECQKQHWQVHKPKCKATQKTLQMAVEISQIGAMAGNLKAQFEVGLAYAEGTGVKRDERKAVQYYTMAADQGHARAQLNLGVCYENGTGVAKDQGKAVHYYTMAAEQMDVQAQYNLADCYEKGTGVPKDEGKAVRYYKMAAEKGDHQAQFKLGFCYENGTGVDKDEGKAVQYYKKAAEQGNVEAQYNLAFCYEHGTGVAQDEKKAVQYYKKAAEQKHVGAQYNLGFCYIYGIGVVKDQDKAVQYCKMAADQGHQQAEDLLAFCYKYGIDVAQGEDEELKKGHVFAEKFLSQLETLAGSAPVPPVNQKQTATKAVEKLISVVWKQMERLSADGEKGAEKLLGECRALRLEDAFKGAKKKDLEEAGALFKSFLEDSFPQDKPVHFRVQCFLLLIALQCIDRSLILKLAYHMVLPTVNKMLESHRLHQAETVWPFWKWTEQEESSLRKLFEHEEVKDCFKLAIEGELALKGKCPILILMSLILKPSEFAQFVDLNDDFQKTIFKSKNMDAWSVLLWSYPTSKETTLLAKALFGEYQRRLPRSESISDALAYELVRHWPPSEKHPSAFLDLIHNESKNLTHTHQFVREMKRSSYTTDSFPSYVNSAFMRWCAWRDLKNGQDPQKATQYIYCLQYGNFHVGALLTLISCGSNEPTDRPAAIAVVDLIRESLESDCIQSMSMLQPFLKATFLKPWLKVLLKSMYQAFLFVYKEFILPPVGSKKDGDRLKSFVRFYIMTIQHLDAKQNVKDQKAFDRFSHSMKGWLSSNDPAIKANIYQLLFNNPSWFLSYMCWDPRNIPRELKAFIEKTEKELGISFLTTTLRYVDLTGDHDHKLTRKKVVKQFNRELSKEPHVSDSENNPLRKNVLVLSWIFGQSKQNPQRLEWVNQFLSSLNEDVRFKDVVNMIMQTEKQKPERVKTGIQRKLTQRVLLEESQSPRSTAVVEQKKESRTVKCPACDSPYGISTQHEGILTCSNHHESSVCRKCAAKAKNQNGCFKYECVQCREDTVWIFTQLRGKNPTQIAQIKSSGTVTQPEFAGTPAADPPSDDIQELPRVEPSQDLERKTKKKKTKKKNQERKQTKGKDLSPSVRHLQLTFRNSTSCSNFPGENGELELGSVEVFPPNPLEPGETHRVRYLRTPQSTSTQSSAQAPVPSPPAASQNGSATPNEEGSQIVKEWFEKSLRPPEE